MTLHDDDLRLQHMLDHAREAIELTEARNHYDLASDRVLSLALIRPLEIIGEAAGRISEEKQKQLSGGTMASNNQFTQSPYPWL